MSGEVQSPDGDAEKKPSERRITITKTGDVRREVLINEAGVKTETWTFGSYKVSLQQGLTAPIVAFVDKQKANAARVDFPDFEWISKQNYAGIEKAFGRDCIIFRGETGGGDTDLPSFASVATMDAQSRLPLSLAIGDETRTYEYASAPQAPLIPPKEAQDAIKSWQTHLQEISKPPPRPF